jgi:NAD-dependent deacetylase
MTTPNSLSSRIEPTKAWLTSVWDGVGKILVLTGAGISAESGIPTFRGEEGYWRIGSRNYFPEELATCSTFESMPDEVWGWYLYRRSVCRAASPNPGHLAVARLEHEFASRGEADRFVLVTQNVDGLHLRAGNTSERTYQIHGNIDFMRSTDDRNVHCFPLPIALGDAWEKGRAIGQHERQLLRCPDGSPARPHVLWFDESYDEPRFRYQSTLGAIEEASVVIVVGTSGATTLPMRVVQRAVQRRLPLLIINRHPSLFSEMALQSSRGHFIQDSAADTLPAVVDVILARASGDTQQ